MTWDTERLGTPRGGDAASLPSDDELAELALAADPNAPLPADAVPYGTVIGVSTSLLPDWYMAPATAVHASKWRRRIVLTVVVAFLLVDAAGLCDTYGFLSWA